MAVTQKYPPSQFTNQDLIYNFVINIWQSYQLKKSIPMTDYIQKIPTYQLHVLIQSSNYNFFNCHIIHVLIKRDLYLKNSSRLSPAPIQKYAPKGNV